MAKYRIEANLINLDTGTSGTHVIEFDTKAVTLGLVQDRLQSIPRVILRTIRNREGISNPVFSVMDERVADA